MTGLPISTQQVTRVALVFAAIVIGFALLSAVTGWPNKDGWGTVVTIALIIALLPLLGPVLTFLRESNAVIEVKGVKLDFRAAVTHGTAVARSNLQDNPGVPVNDSDSASVAEAAQAAQTARIVVVDLGSGKNWYPTRLFALAAAAQELGGARAIVLLAQRGTVPKRFCGWIAPRDAVAAFCEHNPGYRKALAEARAILHHLRLSGGDPTYPLPAVSFDAGNFVMAYQQAGDLAFVPALIYRLQQQQLEAPANPVWLGAEEAERLFDPWLVRDHIREGQSDAEKWAALARAPGDFLAVSDDLGAYRGMIEIATLVRRAALTAAIEKS